MAEENFNFVPPYSNNPHIDATGFNQNLQMSNWVIKYKVIDPVTQGPGDHGISTPKDGSTPHTEQDGIPYHHNMAAYAKGSMSNLANSTTFVVTGTPLVATDAIGYSAFGLLTTSGSPNSAISEYNIGLGVPWRTDAGVQQMWKTFFTQYVHVNANEWEAHHDYYHYLFGKFLSQYVEEGSYTVNGVTQASKDLYFGDQNEVTEENVTGLVDGWAEYLKSSTDLAFRQQASFLWAYRKVLAILVILQKVAATQSTRILELTDAEDDSVARINKLSFTIPSDNSDASATTKNQKIQGYIQAYRTQENIISKYVDSQDSIVSSAVSGIQSQASIMTTVIQQLQSLVQGIFNR